MSSFLAGISISVVASWNREGVFSFAHSSGTTADERGSSEVAEEQGKATATGTG